MKRILVIRGGAIGDFVLTLPAIHLLRDAFPGATLEILGYKHIIALAENRFYANASRSIEYGALASFFARDGDLPTELADYFHSFDLVVSYLFDPDRVFEGNIARCGVDVFLACSPKVDGSEHAAIQLARSLEQLELRLATAAARLYPSAADRALSETYLAAGRVIAIHSGSGSPTKNWPIKKWQELARHLLDSDAAASLLIIGGEADAHPLAAMKQTFGSERVRFAEKLALPLLTAALERCALFLGHDSGISHIAAAVDTPCVLLFGPTDPAVWAPANPRVRVLRAPEGILDVLPMNVVAEAAIAALPTTS
ncbi:MAG: glycosyltransferase family 9 protein [Verrucomicrobiota bacterium]|nr:glycosyltransferase family 9 protein [Verrucomicrobiota bacterium]